MQRQVPQYLLIGNSRVAQHFRYYFSHLQIPFFSWSRAEPLDKLTAYLPQASHILILIKDAAIDDFIAQHLKNTLALKIHFSGSLCTPHAFGAHPLLGFTHALYDLSIYPTIPFIIDEDAPDFAALLPGLANPHYRLSKAKKAKYHAICVLAGNFSCLLWNKLLTTFEDEFNLPHTAVRPYLKQQTTNLLHDPSQALTGPLTRNDISTMEKNLAALADDPFQQIYQSFVQCYEKLK